MGFNRFSGIVNSEYVPLPLDKLMEAGLYMDQKAQKNVDKVQGALDTLYNMPSWGEADTNKKNEIMGNLNNKVNELSSKNFNDPLVQNQINHLIYSTANSPEVQTIASHALLAPKYFKNEQDWIDNNGEQLSFLKEPRDYMSKIYNEFTLDPSGAELSGYMNLGKYDDYKKPLTDLAKDMKASGYTVSQRDGKYIWKNGDKELSYDQIAGVLSNAVKTGWLTTSQMNTLSKDANFLGATPDQLLAGIYNTLGNTYKVNETTHLFDQKDPNYWDTDPHTKIPPTTPQSLPNGVKQTPETYQYHFSDTFSKVSFDSNGNINKDAGLSKWGTLSYNEKIASQTSNALKYINDFKTKFPQFKNATDQQIASLLITIEARQADQTTQGTTVDASNILNKNFASSLLSTDALSVTLPNGATSTIGDVVKNKNFDFTDASQNIKVSTTDGYIGNVIIQYGVKDSAKGGSSKYELETSGGIDYKKLFENINNAFPDTKQNIPYSTYSIQSDPSFTVNPLGTGYTVTTTPNISTKDGSNPTGWTQMVHANLDTYETANQIGFDPTKIYNLDGTVTDEYIKAVKQEAKLHPEAYTIDNNVPVGIDVNRVYTKEQFKDMYVAAALNSPVMEQFNINKK